MTSKLELSLGRSFNFTPLPGLKLKDLLSESSSFDLLGPISRG